ncbi:MAG: DUF6263 family protein [Fuerstiella sp.]|nr:DUF6263 family protein [Fuerstiella sp.]
MTARICLWLALTACVTSTARSGDLLEWKLSTGESLKYTVQNEMVTTSTVGGFDNQSRLLQTMNMVWDVDTLTANRNFVVSQAIKRIRVEMSPNQSQSIVFDSGLKESPDDPFVRSLGNVFRKIVDRDFMVTMGPTGAIKDVSIPEDLLETLKTAAAGTPTGVDEPALKQMLSQTSVLLPTNPVENGDTWQSQQTVELPFTTLRLDARMTYKGLDDNGLAVIDYSPTVTLERKDDAPVKLTLTDSRGTGHVLFDRNQGRMVRMQLNLHMEMQSEIRGTKALQKIDQQTVMVLKH